MTVRPWRLSAEDFAALARGEGGARAVRALRLARRSRTSLLIRMIAAAPEARPAYRLLVDADRASPSAVAEVLDYPSVGAWATRTALALRRGSPARPVDLAFVAAAAALRAGVPARVDLPAVEVCALPSLGLVHDPRTLAYEPLPEVDLGSHAVRLDVWAGGGVPPGLAVATRFDLERWRSGLAGAWGVLERDHPAMAEEFAELVTVLTPMPPSPTGTSSATAADAFGCVFLSLAPDPETFAVTLAHEAQHTKLVALMDLFPLLVPDRREIFYAPWREDPRPLAGLLHGTYAHLGVAAFWRARRGLHAQTEYARWRSAALTTAETLLSSGKLTPTGHTFVTGMAEVLRRWCAEPVHPDAAARAAEEAAAHRSRWQARVADPR
ncbi:aKG-HExxH-type peptide beta-hydroxylase [Saccharothrix australiensis]|uniref:HEXXH motif-containing protein n=1 Tax=Saccharothrix australiensis TaxID=2072 RepID=A0A495W477_9PSEU|nr:HEXXH motif-containing putative peptide modification protein [Saccharothrix australiensis]RKT56476.1 HEXXH motif-containing protein [Saccharothrix australiensis]